MVSYLSHIVFRGCLWPELMVFWPIQDSISWSPRSNNPFGIWKHLLNLMWVSEVINRPQKGPHMVLNSKFFQSYCKYPVHTRAGCRWVPYHDCLSFLSHDPLDHRLQNYWYLYDCDDLQCLIPLPRKVGWAVSLHPSHSRLGKKG